MAQGKSKSLKTTSVPGGDLQVSVRPVLFPGEDTQTYESLRDALLQDLAPQTAYERVLVEDLINLEWEKVRHRRLRDQLVLNSAREVAAHTFDPELASYLGFEHASPTARQHAAAFVGPDTALRRKAIAVLRDLDKDPAEIMALAYRAVGEAAAVHERKLAEIEGRRRKLMRDCQDLRASRARVVASAAE